MLMPNFTIHLLEMKIKKILYIIPCLLAVVGLFSCEESSEVGSSLIKSEISVEVDSSFMISGRTVSVTTFNARSMTQLIGRFSAPEYGDLQCSFVTQLMPAVSMNIPDSITAEMVDSLRLRFRFANGDLTGDSLAPQQLKVYQLTKQLPSDITNAFNPEGYYDSKTPLGVKSYTGSALGMKDSLFNVYATRSIFVDMPKKMAVDIFNAYRTNPELFQWPENFNKVFHGIYVEQAFGRGCVINISSTDMILYYHTTYKTNTVNDEGQTVSVEKIARDTTTLFSVSPEILSSNNIKYTVAESLKNRVANGELVMTSPTGYNVEITFPTQDILDKYWSANFNLAVINNLTFSVPVKEIKNDYDITPAPYLLMVKSSELDDFFSSSKVPDNKTSFYATYDSENKQYNFSTMREYIVELMRAGATVAPEDCEFTLVPVYIATETSGMYSTTTVVTSCTPYIYMPTMCILNIEDAKVKFTFSKQVID